jgi:RNA polymerase sigma factor (sigma-70 family)
VTVCVLAKGYRSPVAAVEPSDAELLVASQDDPERFSEIFRRHHDTIFRYVARRVGVEAAPDVTAQVFVTAFRKRRRYDVTYSSCRPWLYGIATNIIGDHIRARRRSSQLYLKLKAATMPTTTGDETARSDEQLDAAALGPILNHALGRLAQRDRDVLLLYAIEDLTYGEIALALGIPVGTVRSRLSRARSQLRELISPRLQNTRWGDNHQQPGTQER